MPRTRPITATTPPSPAPVGARRATASAKSEQRVRDILRVGREVLAEKGYERATTIEIAQRLGISEATVFTYFRGKRELCVRVISDWYDEIIAAMQTVLSEAQAQQQPLRQQMALLMRTHLQLFLIQGTGLCALVLSEGRSKGQELGDSFAPLQRRYTAPLMDLLARGQASGEIRQDIPLRLLRPMVLGPMEHILWEVVGQTSGGNLKTTDLETTSRALQDMVWAAIAAPDQELAQLRRFKASILQAVDG
ncbi:TetR/AcrR family transcriptional regulator [Ideonella sp.]|jgi:AcrR family transcriptional regulator|uniref:TetR/AcrR family transcriptional regulator n=1 Tax=Ideonella sp. TaxID=1929293 RepID=UPI0037C14BC8